MSSTQNIPPEQLSEIVSLVRDATRIEMWTLELVSEMNAATPRNPNQAVNPVEEKLEVLSLNLDRRPPDLDMIALSMAQLGPELAQVLRTRSIVPERLRNGIAAAVTYAGLYSKRVEERPVTEPQRRFAEWMQAKADHPNFAIGAQMSRDQRTLTVVGSAGGPSEIFVIQRAPSGAWTGGEYRYQPNAWEGPAVVPMSAAQVGQFLSITCEPNGERMLSEMYAPTPMPPLRSPGGGTTPIPLKR